MSQKTIPTPTNYIEAMELINILLLELEDAHKKIRQLEFDKARAESERKFKEDIRNITQQYALFDIPSGGCQIKTKASTVLSAMREGTIVPPAISFESSKEATQEQRPHRRVICAQEQTEIEDAQAASKEPYTIIHEREYILENFEINRSSVISITRLLEGICRSEGLRTRSGKRVTNKGNQVRLQAFPERAFEKLKRNLEHGDIPASSAKVLLGCAKTPEMTQYLTLASSKAQAV